MKEISFQLYSARNIPLADALKIISSSGYTSVEAYRDNVADIGVFQTLLSDHGLHCSSIHIGRDELRDNMSHVLDLSARLGVEQVVCPYLLLEDRPQDKAGWQQMAEELAAYATQVNAQGLTFAWHNHDFEFVKTSDGALPIRVLLDTATDMQWEIDLGWIQRASENPESWLRTYRDRVSAVHLKDVAASTDREADASTNGNTDDEDGWADVGHGVMDWRAIAVELNLIDNPLYVVEHDNPSDVERFAERSIATINEWDLA